ncbi:hypothetical protein [Cryptosporangium phraense]|uniref:hypothetical protein n=1 Tax=Cryptosporangium phraense TaxID=2593070 RepID=UPI001479802E|nr:hypothetical protein [Cryptosporangium phraense]
MDDTNPQTDDHRSDGLRAHLAALSNDDLADLVRTRSAERYAAVFELGNRAKTDRQAIDLLAGLFDVPAVQEDQILHRGVPRRESLRWFVILELLNTDQPDASQLGCAAFGRLTSKEQAELLDRLGVHRIEDYE